MPVQKYPNQVFLVPNLRIFYTPDFAISNMIDFFKFKLKTTQEEYLLETLPIEYSRILISKMTIAFQIPA